MSREILHAFTIPVLMLMQRDLEAQIVEYSKSYLPTAELDKADCKAMLKEKR